ncbi:MAG: ArnT family glycosyltransferase [Candidatus Binatia bacterium]
MTVLLLKLAALAAVSGAQAVVTIRPWLSVAGVAFGMLLFVAAERLMPAAPEPLEQRGAPPPRRFWWLFGAGSLTCFVAGILTRGHAPPPTTQPVWLCGMLLLAASALLPWRCRRWHLPSPRVLAAVLLILLFASGLFGWHLATTPPEVHGDEAEVGNDALRLLQRSPFNLFTTGWYGLPMFHAVPAAAGLSLFGVNLLGLRLPSAVMGVGSVLLLFVLAYRFWGFEVACISAVLLTSARFFIHLSRTGYHYIGTPFISVLVAWLFSRAWEDRSLPAAVWCGIALGLGIQGYFATRLVPVLLTCTFLLWLAGSKRSLVRARTTGFAVIVVAACATAAPMIGYFSHHWGLFWARTRGTSVFTEGAIAHLSYGYGTNDLARILLIQARKAFTLFNATGDTSLQYGYVAGGLFDPLTAVLFLLGCAALCARPRQRAHLLVLLWIIIPVVAGAALTIDAPFFPRISGTVPFAALAAAVGLRSLLASIRAVLPRSSGRVAAGAVAASVLAAVFANNVHSYFWEYAPHHRHGPAVDISAWIRAHGAGKTTYLVGGAPSFSIKHGTIRFLTHGLTTRDIPDLDAYLRRRHLDPASSLFVIMPRGHDLVRKLSAAVGPLAVKAHRNIHNQIDFYTGVPLKGTERSSHNDGGAIIAVR